MGKKQREAAKVQVEPTAPKRPKLEACLTTSADGKAMIVYFPAGQGHGVRIEMSFSAHIMIGRAVKGLTAIIDKMASGVELPTSKSFSPIMEQLMWVERDIRSMHMLKQVLVERQRALEEPKINTRGAPTQALVDAFLKSGGKIENEEERAKRTLEDKYGLNVDDFLEGMDLAI